MIERNDLNKLRDLPIEEVAQRLGLSVVRHRALCCFHDDHHPSMGFNVRRNSFRCYSCGAHGGVIDLAMHVLGKSFVETCGWLDGSLCLAPRVSAPNAGVREARKFDAAKYARFFEHPVLNDAARHFLFDERHLHPKVVEYCRLCSFRDWLQIPYFDALGHLIGVQLRYMGTDKEQPRFRFLQGEQPTIYNQQVLALLRPGEPLYIGEGPSDVWALLSSGKKAIGIPSATLFRKADLELLRPLKLLDTTLHIYPDRDAAGERLYQQLLHAANEIGVCLIRHELPEGCKDFGEKWKGSPPQSPQKGEDQGGTRDFGSQSERKWK